MWFVASREDRGMDVDALEAEAAATLVPHVYDHFGARAAFLGRPVMSGLATGGEAGVRRVLESVHEELVTAMDLLGASSVAHLTRDLVVPT
jgi:hypothetical protein